MTDFIEGNHRLEHKPTPCFVRSAFRIRCRRLQLSDDEFGSVENSGRVYKEWWMYVTF